jgi:hypothetical protein
MDYFFEVDWKNQNTTPNILQVCEYACMMWRFNVVLRRDFYTVWVTEIYLFKPQQHAD